MVSVVPVVGVGWNLLDALGAMVIALEQSQKSQKEENHIALWNVISAAQLTTLTLPQLLLLLPAFQSMMVGSISLSQLGAVTGGWGFAFAMGIAWHIENQSLQQHHESAMSLLEPTYDNGNDNDSGSDTTVTCDDADNDVSDTANTGTEEARTSDNCGSLEKNYTAWKKYVDQLWYCPEKRRAAQEQLMKSVNLHPKRDNILCHITAIEKHDRARRIWAGCTVTMGLVAP